MKKLFSLALAAAMALSMLTGCGNSNNTNTNNDANSAGTQGSQTSQTEQLSGVVNTNGSTSMEKVMQVLIEAFKEQQPNVTVNYTGSGSGRGRDLRHRRHRRFRPCLPRPEERGGGEGALRPTSWLWTAWPSWSTPTMPWTT